MITKLHVLQTAAIRNPNLHQEMQLFKATVRQITKHELNEEQSRWFHMNENHRWRRLANLGVTGNQAGIAAYCKTNQAEEQAITDV